jgi:hypothetical protein
MIMNRGYLAGGTGSKVNRPLTPQRDMYAKPDNRVEYQIFGSEYFSNADVKIYIGDIWIDDATAISLQLQEEVMPIYGYNSFTFDTVARGKRLVQGGITINFTTGGYLHQIIENAEAIFYALETGEQKGLVKPEYYQNMKLDEILRKLGKNSFEEIADDYEKAIWGDEDKTESLNYANKPYFRQNGLGFDIRIQYGAVSESTGYVQDKFYLSEKKEKPNTTVDIINGVQLNGMSKEITTANQGAPILEYYNFIARDLNGVSLAHLQRQKGNREDDKTTYRKMQYGPIR